MAATDTILDNSIVDRMIELRRAIHQNPELSHDENATSALVRQELEAAGIGPIVEVAGTGLIVDIPGSGDGPTLAIRADLDALPMTEQTGLPFASTNDGVMHACGHDSHTAMVLATALTLKNTPDSFAGTARIIFQPAEEAEPLGGRVVIAEGHLDGVDGVIGIHVDPLLETGCIGVRAGAFSASSDELNIIVRGTSAHGAKPHEGVDGIVVAAALVGQLQSIVSRSRDPFELLVVTLGTIEGGTIRNILADEVRLTGTIRTMNEDVRAMAHERIQAIADGLAKAYGATIEIEINQGEPVLMNDAAMVELINDAAADVAGPDCAFAAAPSSGSDDFAFYGQIRPSVYFRLGVGNPAKGCDHTLHHPKFAIDEDAMSLGAAVLVRAARRFLTNARAT
ncbi:MAG: amidohydrolase [Alphaproteobacteria bacterium]